jgi:6-phosphofructokinase 1
VSYIHNEGGSILRTARANPTKSNEDLRNCVAALQNAGISALVSIGGDDTAYSASRVARFAQENMGVALRSAHIPKTIDNDLPLPEDIPTFGFETARELGARLVMNLKRDAITNQHWFLVITMGRQSGHLALGIGNSAVATITLIPEEWSGRDIRLKERCWPRGFWNICHMKILTPWITLKGTNMATSGWQRLTSWIS